jgi:hypothetical protein
MAFWQPGPDIDRTWPLRPTAAAPVVLTHPGLWPSLTAAGDVGTSERASGVDLTFATHLAAACKKRSDDISGGIAGGEIVCIRGVRQI